MKPFYIVIETFSTFTTLKVYGENLQEAINKVKSKNNDKISGREWQNDDKEQFINIDRLLPNNKKTKVKKNWWKFFEK